MNQATTPLTDRVALAVRHAYTLHHAAKVHGATVHALRFRYSCRSVVVLVRGAHTVPRQYTMLRATPL